MALIGAALVHECGVLQVPREVVQVSDIAMAWAITSLSVAATEQAGDLFCVPHCAIIVSDVWSTISQIGNPSTSVLHAIPKSLTTLKSWELRQHRESAGAPEWFIAPVVHSGNRPPTAKGKGDIAREYASSLATGSPYLLPVLVELPREKQLVARCILALSTHTAGLGSRACNYEVKPQSVSQVKTR